MPTVDQQLLSDILADNNIEVSDELFFRRVRWPDNADAPPYTRADVAQLSIPAFDPDDRDGGGGNQAVKEWPTDFITATTYVNDAGQTVYVNDPDDPHLSSDDTNTKNLVIDLTKRTLDADVVEQRSKGSRDFSAQLSDDDESTLQNLIRTNDVVSWYQNLFNPLAPHLGTSRVKMGDFLVDESPETVADKPGQIALRGRDSIKLLMLDNFVGEFAIDRIDETKDTKNGCGKRKLSLVRESSDSERVVFILDTDKDGDPIPPVYNWTNQPDIQVYKSKYQSDPTITKGFVRIAEKDGAWQVLLGDGQIWINREWFDDNIGWSNGKKISDYKSGAYAYDPMTEMSGADYANTPKYDLWVALSRYLLPEDSVTYAVANAPSESTPIGNDGTDDYIQLDAASDVASIPWEKYNHLTRVNFTGNAGTDALLILKRVDTTNKRLYVKSQKVKDRTESLPLSNLGISAGDTVVIGEINQPETAIRRVLKSAGFQDYSDTKPFYINVIEPVYSTYLWDEAAGFIGAAYTRVAGFTKAERDADATLKDRDVNAVDAYPQSFALSNTGSNPATHHYDTYTFAHYRQVTSIYLDITSPAGSGFVGQWEVYDADADAWTVVTADDITLDSTKVGGVSYQQSGYIEIDRAFLKANSKHYSATSDTDAGELGLANFTDQTYPHRFLFRLSRTDVSAAASPIFATIRPAAPVQIQPEVFKDTDEKKHWDVLEKHIRPFLPPNYEWRDDGNLNIECKLLKQDVTTAYALDKLFQIERESGDSEIYTEVIARGRRRDIVNLLSPYNGRQPVIWMPYKAQGWNGSAYVNKETPHGEDNTTPSVGVYMEHPDRVDDEDATLWAGDGSAVTTPWYFDAISNTYYDKYPYKSLLDNAAKTFAADFHMYGTLPSKYFDTDNGGILKASREDPDITNLEEDFPTTYDPDPLEEDQAFDGKWILACMFDSAHEIGSFFLNPGKIKLLHSSGEYSANYIRKYMLLEIWKSETTDDLANYELMVPQFALNDSQKKLIKKEEFVSGNNRAKFIRVKCVEAAKSLDISEVIKVGGRKRGRRIYSTWQLANFRVYEDDLIEGKAVLGVDALANDYTANDLERDARWRRRYRPRTLVIPFVNEYANTETDVKKEAAAWLRELFRKFLSLRVTGCRPDVKVGDTVTVTHPLTDESSVWAGMMDTTSPEYTAKEAARLAFLENERDFLVEEVTKSKGGKVTARIVCYRTG